MASKRASPAVSDIFDLAFAAKFPNYDELRLLRCHRQMLLLLRNGLETALHYQMALTLLAETCIKFGDESEVIHHLQLFRQSELYQATKPSDQRIVDIWTVRCLLRLNRCTEAREVFHELVATALTPDDRKCLKMYLIDSELTENCPDLRHEVTEFVESRTRRPMRKGKAI